MKWILLIIMVLLVAPLSFADTVYGTVNKQANLYATIISTDFYPSSQANITIINPQLVTVITNKAMTSLGTGKYVYNYTPNLTGEYLVSVQFFNSTGGLLGTGTNLLESQTSPFLGGESSMAFVTLIAIGIALASLLYLTFKLDKEYMPIKLLFLIVSMGLIVLSAYTAVESVTGTTNAPSILFYAVLIVYSVFFFYVGFKLIFTMLDYFRKAGA
jgi:hypothetical protein